VRGPSETIPGLTRMADRIRCDKRTRRTTGIRPRNAGEPRESVNRAAQCP
jgi:hypothetical protein